MQVFKLTGSREVTLSWHIFVISHQITFRAHLRLAACLVTEALSSKTPAKTREGAPREEHLQYPGA